MVGSFNRVYSTGQPVFPIELDATWFECLQNITYSLSNYKVKQAVSKPLWQAFQKYNEGAGANQ